MNLGNTNLPAELPVPEAAELVAFSAKNAIPLPVLIGYFVLVAAYGPMHPVVLDFDKSHSGPPLIPKTGDRS